LGLLLLILSLTAGGVQAQDPVVRAVLFYSPSCPHCHTVINEVLPPLQNQYGSSLQILGVNAAEIEGSELFHAALDEYGIPADQRGVPTLIVGDQLLVGSGQIPAEFPGIIERGLQEGGIPWPEIPGLSAYREQAAAESADGEDEQQPAATDPAADPAADPTAEPVLEPDLTVAERFRLDPAGNTLAVIVLFGMLGALFYAAVSWRDGIFAAEPGTYNWLIPVLSAVGLIVALYLSFVEVTQTEAICGPVGNCNAVQQSPYATLFGLIPVGLLGAAGYVFILAAWGLKRWGPESWRPALTLVIWAGTLFGLFFSIYLTFLEPFVIGATCLWCITSAVVMTGLFLVASDPALAVLRGPDPVSDILPEDS
jgi:uncharacterized membrane protein